MKLHLKFAGGSDSAQREVVRNTATRLGADDVRPLFPDESENELAALFVVDLPEGLDATALMDALRRDDAVETVEVAAPRWLTVSA